MNILTPIKEKLQEEIEEKNNKFILDACCGGRMFWFDKQQPNTIYIDNRRREKGHSNDATYKRNHSINPDILMDNRKMDFPDKSFKLVVFDPPHLIGKPDGCRMTKNYGALNKDTWKSDIKKGFDECWRVLEDYGILIFKWNDASKSRKELLALLEKQPLFGHPNGSKIPTHWFCFMKIPNNPIDMIKQAKLQAISEVENLMKEKVGELKVGLRLDEFNTKYAGIEQQIDRMIDKIMGSFE